MAIVDVASLPISHVVKVVPVFVFSKSESLSHESASTFRISEINEIGVGDPHFKLELRFKPHLFPYPRLYTRITDVNFLFTVEFNSRFVYFDYID